MSTYYIYERKFEGKKEKLVEVCKGTQAQCAAYVGKLVAEGKQTHNLLASTLQHKAAEAYHCTR